MITNNIYADGFGENFKFIIYSILYSEYLDEDFHYTPLNDIIQHNYNNDPKFINMKEKLINIINTYLIAKNNINYNRPDRFRLLHFFENNVDFCSKSNNLEKLKIIFKEVNKNKFDKSFFNIAIHIRRMNTLDKEKNTNYDQIPGTDVPNDIYKDIILQLKNIYKNCKIHIYSQGDQKDFDFEDDIILHLNESIEDTFIDFVFADILVVAPSSFSYSAALLSDNIIYYLNSCHKPLPTWNIIQNYTSTHDRYQFFIRTSPFNKETIYYDTKLGKFYKEISKDNIEYIDMLLEVEEKVLLVEVEEKVLLEEVEEKVFLEEVEVEEKVLLEEVEEVEEKVLLEEVKEKVLLEEVEVEEKVVLEEVIKMELVKILFLEKR